MTKKAKPKPAPVLYDDRMHTIRRQRLEALVVLNADGRAEARVHISVGPIVTTSRAEVQAMADVLAGAAAAMRTPRRQPEQYDHTPTLFDEPYEA